MTSIIRVEPFSGSMDESPLCYLLQVDEFHFLLDCGWSEAFDMNYIANLKKRVPQIDAVLLSYADVPHLGALPYLVGKCGLSCPVYATVPVFKMGQMFMYDWFQSHQNVEDFNLFTLDDVDAAFEKVQPLKFSQNVSLKGRGHGLQIIPLPAGHMIGGTVWRVRKAGEEEVVYAVDYNHKKERHLNGCSFETISRPSLLITDSYNARYAQARRKARDEELLTLILSTVRRGGNALVVIDTAGRVLELAQLLDQLWNNADAGLISYSLVLLNNVAYNVVEFAKSQVEWMSDKVMKSFEELRNNPFQFRHMQIIHSLNELRRVRPPMVVLASCPEMEVGFSRELFVEWCGNPKNSVILTSRAHGGTLTRKLIDLMKTKGTQVTIEVKKRVRLEGVELEDFWKEKKQKEQELARQRLEAQRRMSRIDTEESDESSDEEGDRPEQLHPYDVMLRFEHQQKSSFFKQARRQYPMFPYVEEKIKWDDYGEIIRPEDYSIAEDSALVPADEAGSQDVEEMDTAAPTTGMIPTKCIRYVAKLDVNCQLAFIDFEGRSDGESIKKLVAQLRPKQLVLIHGTVDSTQHLGDFCKTIQGVSRVFTPAIGSVVDATVESHIYHVTLTDNLMNSLDFQPVKDAELTWVDARMLMKRAVTNEDADEALADAMEQECTPCLDILPDAPIHQAVFVNDPKLSDLRQILRNSGLHGEFSAGVLYVNNMVAIRHAEAGKFQVEGTACEEYYKIRDILYNQFAIV